MSAKKPRRKFLQQSFGSVIGAVLTKASISAGVFSASVAKANLIYKNLKYNVGNWLWWGKNSGPGIYQKSTIPKFSGITKTFQLIESGYDHTLAIDSTGQLWAMGSNTNGQLGLGNTLNISSPVQVGVLADWKTVSTGSGFTLALKGNTSPYTLWSWGQNDIGQLGHGNLVNQSSPVQVGTFSWLDISVGPSHVMAIRSDNTLWAWGMNSSGQLGDGTKNTLISPTQISGTGWIRASTNASHSVAIKVDGSLWAWGDAEITKAVAVSPSQLSLTPWQIVAGFNSAAYIMNGTNSLFNVGENNFGQLGVDNTNNYSSVIQVGADVNWERVVFGNSHVLAIKGSTLWGWGYNLNYQLGLGTNTNRSSPVQISGTVGWSDISGGYYHSLAIKSGALFAAGNNSWGQLGDGTVTNRNVLSQIGIETNWAKVSCSTSFSMGLKLDGSLWYWGTPNYLPLMRPTQIGTYSDWTDIASGRNSIMGLRGGSLWVSGENSEGECGNGNTSNISYPLQIGTQSWLKVTKGSRHSLAIRSDGTLWSWGANASGQLGNGTLVNRSSPIQVGADTGWIYIAGSYSNSNAASVAIKEVSGGSGSLWIWGENSDGQLGQGDLISRSIPTQVGTDTNWKRVAMGTTHTVAIKADGSLWAWGSNSSCELGDGTNIAKSSPVQIGSDFNWSEVACGGDHSLALKADGTIWAWGYNSYGQLGGGAQWSIKAVPTKIGTDSDWIAIEARNDSSAAIKANNSLWFWGLGDQGRFGDGQPSTVSLSPKQMGIDLNWAKVDFGFNFTLARKTDGRIFGWGVLGLGQLGLGTSTIPIRVGLENTWTDISCGEGFVVAKRTDGTLWGWGENGSYQLGVGTTARYSSPVQIGSAITWSKISVGKSHALAISISGNLYAWGANDFAQVGNGGGANISTPLVIGTNTWSDVSAGGTFSIAKDTGGNIFTWGSNTKGQLGLGWSTLVPRQIGLDSNWIEPICLAEATILKKSDGSFWGFGRAVGSVWGSGIWNDLPAPSQIISSGIYTKLAAGDYHVLGLKADGTVWSWGSNSSFGPLGDGSTSTGMNYARQIGPLAGVTKIFAKKYSSHAIK